MRKPPVVGVVSYETRPPGRGQASGLGTAHGLQRIAIHSGEIHAYNFPALPRDWPRKAALTSVFSGLRFMRLRPDPPRPDQCRARPHGPAGDRARPALCGVPTTVRPASLSRAYWPRLRPDLCLGFSFTQNSSRPGACGPCRVGSRTRRSHKSTRRKGAPSKRKPPSGPLSAVSGLPSGWLPW